MDEEAARATLATWRESRPGNYYDATPNLARVLASRAGPERLSAMEPRLRAFGREVAEVVDPSVDVLERHREFPAHVTYDPVGRRIEEVEFHPEHHRAGQAVWGSGMLATSRGEGPFELAALFYLLSHAGEGGHACPVVCTVGLARAVEHRGSEELKARYLELLRSTDFGRCLRASQFLTEIQGGSDVGANTTRAVPDDQVAGAWRLSGEKWFCSVADADVFAVTARRSDGPAGTRGLGCFLVPRHLEDGAVNGFRIRRLKDKLGTRALASAEMDFDGALAWPIGPVGEGFHVVVEELLNTSRWLNAVGSTGLMRRAYLEASSFARHRSAFGRSIGSFPPVREQLAVIKSEEHAALSSTMALTGLLDRLDRGLAGEDEAETYRVLVNVNKYLTSVAATDAVHRAVEVLGGNGTIEDFSPLPRLYRDALVFESWEGTHNVLCAQVYRDCLKLSLLDHVFSWTRSQLAASGEAGGDTAQAVALAADSLQGRMKRSLEDPEHAAVHFRRQLGHLMRVIQAACLLAEAHQGRQDHGAAARGTGGRDAGRGDEKAAVAELFVRRHLLPCYEPEDDPRWQALVEETLAGEAG
jgi:alkylation response protein AidB-like acyl-CoA dehydrogenase